jgi:hypothetical protein
MNFNSYGDNMRISDILKLDIEDVKKIFRLDQNVNIYELSYNDIKKLINPKTSKIYNPTAIEENGEYALYNKDRAEIKRIMISVFITVFIYVLCVMFLYIALSRGE